MFLVELVCLSVANSKGYEQIKMKFYGGAPGMVIETSDYILVTIWITIPTWQGFSRSEYF